MLRSGSLPVPQQGARPDGPFPLSGEQKKEEIRFWHRQFLEHCLFIFMGLQSVSALLVPECMQALMSPLPENQPQVSAKVLKDAAESAPYIDQLKEKAHELVCRWGDFEQKLAKDVYDIPQLNHLLTETGNLKRECIRLQKTGLWIGWLYPEFLDHILEELDFFYDRIQGTVSPTREVEFYTDMNADHVALSAHLLDNGPKGSQVQLVVNALSLAQTGYDMNKPETTFNQMVALSHVMRALDYAKQVDAFNKQAERDHPPSIIHPMLLKHEEREGLWSIKNMERLASMIPQNRAGSPRSGLASLPIVA
jgi:hypothetical protein